ncbi:MAG: RNA methyltransferase [Nitrososphaerales archaeon]|nr:RNA methyltransferase [Nitrososphaerales archaeon]
MRSLSIALVEPFYEVNVGHVARVMKNFGIDELLLIKPRVDLSKARKFASHGVDILEKSKETNFNHMVKNFDMIVGTTAIVSKKPSNIARKASTPEDLAKNLGGFVGSVCLVFGREATGLNNKELKLCDLVVSIPTGTDYRTLNISHSVAIILYEISKQGVESIEERASREDRERVIKYSMKLAKICSYKEHKIPLLRNAMKRLLAESRISPREAYLAMGLFRKAVLALEKEKKG